MDTNKQEIIAYCHMLSEKGYVAAYDGNISVLLENGQLLITPTQTRKAAVTADMLVLLDKKGAVIEGYTEPSSEAGMHNACYEARADIGAVVHAHPPFATALSCTTGVDDIGSNILLPEILMTTGVLGVVPYATPGSVELALATGKAITSHDGVLLKNHGVVAVGKDLAQAYARLESIEHYCKVKLIAESSGECRYLSSL